MLRIVVGRILAREKEKVGSKGIAGFGGASRSSEVLYLSCGHDLEVRKHCYTVHRR